MENMDLFNDELILYHGSKSGIKGEIEPCSRAKCDFGKGFYLGDNPTQPQSLIAAKKYSKSKFYKIALNLQNLAVYRFDIDMKWALFIAYNRQILKLPTKITEQLSRINEFDVIIGVIADDSMTMVLQEFYSDALTDTALLEALQFVKLGEQYVLKTEKACKQAKILSESTISTKDRELLYKEAIHRRITMQENVQRIRRKHLRDGRYFSEILGDYYV